MEKNQGYKFEQILYDKIKALNMFDEIHHERDLKRKWGWDAASIDYLLVRKDKVIVLQAKWRKTRRRENAHITNFLKSINHIGGMIQQEKKIVFGLWASRREPFEDNQCHLKEHNIYCVSDFTSMSRVANRVAEILLQHSFYGDQLCET